ncbi:MAG TPA: PQQ-binding-like beta-propeller repeat protein, partial [Pirellulaceae bacterium]|nr:PQQ-binding-like beta-propeller repeat protein [Pirellulaceae bacterium]
MPTVKSIAANFAVLCLGFAAAALLVGCQPAAPPAAGSGGNGTTDGLDITMPTEEPTPTLEESPAPDQPETDKPAEPAPAETPAEEKRAAATPAEEQPAEAKPAEEATSADTKPAAGETALENPALHPGDWTQWGGSSLRNNVPIVENVVTEWNPGKFDRKTGAHDPAKAQNIKWVTPLGTQTYGNTVVAGGKVFVGTNNTYGYLKRYPGDGADAVDLGCLICLDEQTGKFLWQHSSEKLPTGRVNDWPLMGICCSPLVEGDRLWFVTSRGEVRCLDINGFYDGKDDGRPESQEPARLFDVTRADDPAEDKVGGYISELDSGKIPADLRAKFEAAGMPLPDGDIAVTADDKAKAPNKKWAFTAKVGESDRKFILGVAGPKLSAFKIVTPADKEEADVIWVFDMMKTLGTSQHNMCSCSVTTFGDILFVNSSNGVDDSHLVIPAPDAPSFIAMNKNTGEVYWTDNSPGRNILHGQWSSPTVAIIGGVPQVLFGGGDGWLYSFKADTGKNGKPELLWKFDINPKDSVLELGGRGTRNDIISTPVVYDNKVYFCTGQDPEHGEGIGILWCIDPTKRGDISEKLAVNRADPKTPIAHKRVQAVVEADGDIAIDNPNSGVVWKYETNDANGDGEIDFEEQFHRSIATVAIKNDLLFCPDFSGLFHCVDAQTGKVYWTYDMLAASWGSPLIAGDKVMIGDEDGDVAVFDL